MDAFDQFVLWVYDQPLTSINDVDLALTYILADKFLVEDLMNAVVDRAKVVFRYHKVGLGGLIELYKSHLSERPLTKLYWEQFAYEVTTGGFRETISSPYTVRLLRELLDDQKRLEIFARELDLSREMLDRAKNIKGVEVDPSTRDDCLYHEHKTTEKCIPIEAAQK